MLKKAQQSMRDITKAVQENLQQKITELQQKPKEIPPTWKENIDENGRTYYIDTVTGEWYRIPQNNAKQHKRINTNEKLHIVSAVSKKEFEEQKKAMDLDNDNDSDDNHTANKDEEDLDLNDDVDDEDLLNTDNTTDTDIDEETTDYKPPEHNTKPTTWKCDKCTLDNAISAKQCNACLAPPPYIPSDDDDDNNSNLSEHSSDSDINNDNNNNNLSVSGNKNGNNANNGNGHQPMNTMEMINATMMASMQELGVDLKDLTETQKSSLLTFIDFTDCEPEPAVKYLSGAQWDVQMAANVYLQDHPDHPKSRQGSLIFDQNDLDLINNPLDVYEDLDLAPNLEELTGATGTGRRGSTELEAPLSKVRDSDNDSDDDVDKNLLSNNDDDNKQDDNPLLKDIDDDINNDVHSSDDQNFVEYDENSGNQSNSIYHPPLPSRPPPAHRRMNTDQRTEVAIQSSILQSEFDSEMNTTRTEIAELKIKLEEKTNENLDLIQKLNESKSLNIELSSEKNKYYSSYISVQKDWHKMSEFMKNILNEVTNIDQQRNNGKKIISPTPKLNDILNQIQLSLNKNTKNGHNLDEKLYKDVANLFSNAKPTKQDIEQQNKIKNSHNKRMSFGGASELFPYSIDENNNINNNNNNNNNNNTNHLVIDEDNVDAHEKRLSYGGVGLLFDNNKAKDDANNYKEEEDEEEEDDYDDNVNPMTTSFKPTYQGVAGLFDEQNDNLQHSKQHSFAGGDILELFTNNNKDEADSDDKVEEESDDSMDKQNTYNYEDDDDDMDEQRVYDYGDDEEEEEQSKDNGIKTIQVEEHGKASVHTIVKKKENPKRQATHTRFDSYQSNLSDPTHSREPSRRTSGFRGSSNRKHSRGPSFTIGHILNRDEDSESDDRPPSVHSAPEEHDYFAISAYYGIADDDDINGWDSRRSSMFGDYGIIPRQSKKIAEKNKLNNILNDKLGNIAGNNDPNVADLFNNNNRSITKSSNDPDDQLGSTVADLFNESDISVGKHKGGLSYSGVRDMFPGDDESGSNDDLNDEDMMNYMVPKGNSSKARPSTNNALGATFDIMPRGRDLDKMTNIKEVKHEDDDNDDDNTNNNSNNDNQEYNPKLSIINDNLTKSFNLEEERKNIEKDLEIQYKNQLLSARNELENELTLSIGNDLTNKLTESLTITLTESLTKEITKKLKNDLINNEKENANDFKSKLKEKEDNYNIELKQNEDSSNQKISEIENEYNNKIDNLQNEMNENEEKNKLLKNSIELLQKSKYKLIESTSKEMNSLRLIIKNHFTNKKKQNNENKNNIFGGLLNYKWMK